MKKPPLSEPSATGFVTGSQDGHHYPTYWKSDFVQAIDGLLQSGSSPEEAYSRVAHDLQAQHFPLSVEEIQRLYYAFRQELAILDSWKKTMRRSGRAGTVQYQETVTEPYTSTEQIRTNSSILEANLKLKNLNTTDDTAASSATLREILQSLPLLSQEEKDGLAMLDPEAVSKISTIALGETCKFLLERCEHESDRFALGALMNLMELLDDQNLDGNIDPVIQKRIDCAIRKAMSKGIRIPRKGSGGVNKISQERKDAIFRDCQRWIPLCRAIKTAGEKLWEEPEYKKSGLYRKEARGRLAEKLDISPEEVESVEAFFTNPCRSKKKRTPSLAAFHQVARNPEHGGVGESTVEAIYHECRKNKNR